MKAGVTWKVALAALSVGMVWWWSVSRWSGAAEPWDVPQYWSVGYPGALVLAAMLGLTWPRRSWMSGAIVMLAQLPVMIVARGVGPLLAFGILFALLLAVPAMMAAAVAGWIRVRAGR